MSFFLLTRVWYYICLMYFVYFKFVSMELKKLISDQRDRQYINAGLVEAYHLLYYLPDRNDVTNWTGRILDFKSKKNIDDYGVITNLVVNAVSNQNLHFDYVIRVLRHNEKEALNDAPIIDFVRNIANVTHATYCPQLLNKTRTTRSLHTLPTLLERQEEIKGVFYVNENLGLDLNGKTLLIVDDITTSCTTIAEMVKTLKMKWPEVNVSLLCLARTLHDNPEANLNL